MVCGRDMGAATTPKPAPAWPAPPRPAPRIHPRMANPPTLMPYRPARPPQPHAHWRGGNPGNWVFLIGLFLLLSSHQLWPGILVVLKSAFLNQAARGRPDKGLGALLWLGGLALLIATNAFWPGIFVLLLLHWMPSGWHW